RRCPSSSSSSSADFPGAPRSPTRRRRWARCATATPRTSTTRSPASGAAPSPGIVATTMMNAYYASHEDYLMALARELRHEYQAIHAAGLILQIDAPD